MHAFRIRSLGHCKHCPKEHTSQIKFSKLLPLDFLTAFGTHVVNQQLDDCWPADVRHGVRVVARILVYSTWGLMAIIA